MNRKSQLPLLAFLFLCSFVSRAQSQYEIITDERHPEQHILRGIINKYLVQNDTSYHWFASSQGYYGPDTSLLNGIERAKSKVQYIVFGGTWCEDTQFILPKFYKLLDMSGVPDSRVTLFGVNRAKTTLGNMAEALNVKNVPTIIVMKDGKEMGRVVEYGKTGKWDKELVEILNGL